MKYAIGVDVGGTKTDIGLVDRSGNVKRKIRFRTPKKKDEFLKKFVKRMSLLLDGVNKKDISGIGLGLPGTVDKKNGKIISMPNIKGIKNFNIQKYVKNKFHLKVEIENDANCAVVAEHKFGNCASNMVLLTLGTGIGGGLIINGKLYSGNGNAIEPGHITIDKEGLKGSCGNVGCVEEYFSVRGILREAKKRGVSGDECMIQKKAEAGDKKARAVYEEAGKNLGIALSDIVKMLDPELIVFSGGLAKAHKLFLPAAVKEMKKRTFFDYKGHVMVARTLENSGVIGAALLVF